MTLLLLFGGLLVSSVALRALVHRAYRAPRIPERGTPADLGLPFRVVWIPGANRKRLFGWYVPGAEHAGTVPAVALMHGWGGNAEHLLPLAAVLHDAGYATLLLDARNHGNSDEDQFSSLPRFAEDLERGLEWLARQPGVDAKRLCVLGHSVGAGAALLVAARCPRLAAAVSISAFAHPGEVMRRQLRAHRIPYRPVGWLVLRYVERTIQARFDDIAPCHSIRRVRCPVLLVHGSRDRRIPSDDALRIYANRPDDRVDLLLLADAGHDLRGNIASRGAALLEFLQRHAPVRGGPPVRVASDGGAAREAVPVAERVASGSQ
jgi:dipeptidyl aminopeptidase/acylaminoacyl peptidase